MRVFIGIKIPEKLERHIVSWQKEHKNLPVRFIKPDNLHITLIPPWYEKRIDKIVKKLNKFKTDLKPFVIGFENIRLGPPGSPRLIWLEGNSGTELARIQKELACYLKKPRDSRPFKTHITAARFKKENYPDIKGLFKDEEISWKMKFSKLILFESKLSSKGADYEIVYEIPI